MRLMRGSGWTRYIASEIKMSGVINAVRCEQSGGGLRVQCGVQTLLGCDVGAGGTFKVKNKSRGDACRSER